MNLETAFALGLQQAAATIKLPAFIYVNGRKKVQSESL